MPIELRPSDVVLAGAEALRKGARAAREIHGSMYEAERVAQVNRDLAYIERSYQDFNETVEQRVFPHYDYDPTNPSAGVSDVKLPFGQATLADVEADEEEFFQSQLEYITRTTTNKAAREEMIQLLQMKHIQNQGIVANRWGVAADHEAMASLNTLYDTVLASNDPWEVKIFKITNRVNEMVAVGRLWRDEGEAIIARATAAAQYSFAQHGAMTMMKQTGDPADGEAWLAENTPFYDGNPDARAQVLSDVRREFDYFAKMHDEALDRDFENLHIRADTLEKVDAALAGLTDTRFYNGDQKYNWEMRFLRRRNDILKDEDLPATLDDMYDQMEAEIWKVMLEAETAGIPNAVIMDMLNGVYYKDFSFEGEVYPNTLRPAFYQKMIDRYKGPANELYSRGTDYILHRSGLEGEALTRALNDYDRWFARNPDASDEDIEQAAFNISRPIVTLEMDGLFGRLWGSLRDEAKFLDPYEKMQLLIQAGGLVGMVDKSAEALALLGARQLEIAKELYPNLNIRTFFPDTTGQYGDERGTIVLINSNGDTFRFTVEEDEKEFTLHRLNLTDDAYIWEEVSLSRTGPTAAPVEPSTIPLPAPVGDTTIDLRAGGTLTIPGPAPVTGLNASLFKDIEAALKRQLDNPVLRLSLFDQMELERAYQDIKMGIHLSYDRTVQIRVLVDQIPAVTDE